MASNTSEYTVNNVKPDYVSEKIKEINKRLNTPEAIKYIKKVKNNTRKSAIGEQVRLQVIMNDTPPYTPKKEKKKSNYFTKFKNLIEGKGQEYITDENENNKILKKIKTDGTLESLLSKRPAYVQERVEDFLSEYEIPNKKNVILGVTNYIISKGWRSNEERIKEAVYDLLKPIKAENLPESYTREKKFYKKLE